MFLLVGRQFSDQACIGIHCQRKGTEIWKLNQIQNTRPDSSTAIWCPCSVITLGQTSIPMCKANLVLEEWKMGNATLVFKHSFRDETGKHRRENLISTPTHLTEVIAVSILSNQQGSVIIGKVILGWGSS